MGPEAFAYPFIFVALFFESFLLVTFLSEPARERRKVRALTTTPNVAIVVPCWDEAATVGGTIESLLALDYPADKLEIILVNDGSTDGTAEAIDEFAEHPQITALHKENGGKFTAMNLGVSYATGAEFIGFLDADSFVEPDALREIVAAFDAPDIAAVTASLSINKPRTLLQRMQYAEYAFSIMIQHVFASINGLYVTPGPFSFYRRATLETLGSFKHAHLAEDMEMAMRIQRAGLKIGNALRARVYTNGPTSLPKLIKQRTRWTTGFLRNLLFEYTDLLGSRKNPALGFIVLPLGVITIAAGITLFAVSLVAFALQALHGLSVISAAPIAYAFTLQAGWLSFPITGLFLASVLLIMSTTAWMFLGKRLSRASGWLLPHLPVYLALYGLVAPIWLINSISHVARGAATTWR